jgi:hypothetical protein
MPEPIHPLTVQTGPTLSFSAFYRLMSIAHDRWRLSADDATDADTAIHLCVGGIMDTLMNGGAWSALAEQVAAKAEVSEGYAYALLAIVFADLHHDRVFTAALDKMPKETYDGFMDQWAAIAAACFKAGWYQWLIGKPAEAAQSLASHLDTLAFRVARAIDPLTTRGMAANAKARILGERIAPNLPKIHAPKAKDRRLPKRLTGPASTVLPPPSDWRPTLTAFRQDLQRLVCNYRMPAEIGGAICAASVGIAHVHLIGDGPDAQSCSLPPHDPAFIDVIELTDTLPAPQPSAAIIKPSSALAPLQSESANTPPATAPASVPPALAVPHHPPAPIEPVVQPLAPSAPPPPEPPSPVPALSVVAPFPAASQPPIPAAAPTPPPPALSMLPMGQKKLLPDRVFLDI